MIKSSQSRHTPTAAGAPLCHPQTSLISSLRINQISPNYPLMFLITVVWLPVVGTISFPHKRASATTSAKVREAPQLTFQPFPEVTAEGSPAVLHQLQQYHGAGTTCFHMEVSRMNFLPLLLPRALARLRPALRRL